jgi:hypothetical protein
MIKIPEGVRTVFPKHPNGFTSTARNFHNKVWASRPWSLTSGWLNFFCTTCLIKDRFRTGTHIVWTVAAVFLYLCLRQKPCYLSNMEWRPSLPRRLDSIATSSGRTWLLDSSRTLNSSWTICHYVRTDATFNSSKLLDTNGHPDGGCFDRWASERNTTSSGWLQGN